VSRFKVMRLGIWAVLLIAPIGCSFAPIFQPSDPELGPEFRNSLSSGGKPSEESVANLPWWEVFEDPHLRGLVKTSLANNRDLQQTAARIAEASAQLGFVRADQFPLIGVAGDMRRVDPGSTFGSAGNFNSFALGADLSFEVDVWGKFRNATEAQRQALYSSEYSYRTVTLTLVAQVAQTYFKLIDFDSRVAIAKNTLATRHESTRIIRAKFDKGIVSELDLNQAQIEEGDAMVSIAAFERIRGLFENSLRTLIGGGVGEISRASSQNFQSLDLNLPTGVPATLLERRPDILAARADVESQYSLIGVAEADRFPSLSILGSFGLRSSESSDFFDTKSKSWLASGGLLGPLIDWGKFKSQADAQRARAEQAAKFYE